MYTPKLTIPADQHVEDGEMVTILIGSAMLYLSSNGKTITASYDIKVKLDEFDPYYHGFKGLNLPLSSLIISLGIKNEYVSKWLSDQLSLNSLIK